MASPYTSVNTGIKKNYGRSFQQVVIDQTQVVLDKFTSRMDALTLMFMLNENPYEILVVPCKSLRAKALMLRCLCCYANEFLKDTTGCPPDYKIQEAIRHIGLADNFVRRNGVRPPGLSVESRHSMVFHVEREPAGAYTRCRGCKKIHRHTNTWRYAPPNLETPA